MTILSSPILVRGTIVLGRAYAIPSTSAAKLFCTSAIACGKSPPGKGKDAVKKAKRIARLGNTKALDLAKEKKEIQSLSLEEAAKVFGAVEVLRPLSAYELHVVTSVSSHQANALRGRISLPKDARTKPEKLLIFAEDGSESSKAAHRIAEFDSGNSIVIGGAEMIQDVVEGRGAAAGDFTKVLATPSLLPQISKSLARSLGPRGLMPSAKRGTVAEGAKGMEEAILQAKGALDWRGDRNGVVRGAVGRIVFTTPELRANISAFLEAIVERVSGGLASNSPQSQGVASPSGSTEGKSSTAIKRASSVIKQIHLSSTQGPSVLLSLPEVY